MKVKTKGTIYNIGEIKTGVARNGKFWKRALLVLKIDDETPNNATSLAITFWNGEAEDLMQQKLKINDVVEVDFSIHSEPSNDFWNSRLTGLALSKIPTETYDENNVVETINSTNKKIDFNELD